MHSVKSVGYVHVLLCSGSVVTGAKGIDSASKQIILIFQRPNNRGRGNSCREGGTINIIGEVNEIEMPV